MKLEENLNRLDEIINSLNNKQTSLEDALGLYAEGVNLVKDSEKELKEARVKVDDLTKDDKKN